MIDAFDFIQRAESIGDLEHECSNFLRLTERNKGNGSAFTYQCTLCGDAIGQEIPKKSVKKIPPPFDTRLKNAFISKRKDILSNLAPNLPQKQCENINLETPLRHILEEKLDSLLLSLQELYPNADIATCFHSYLTGQRQSSVNALLPQFKSETEISDWFKTNFSEWFYIYEEVWGVGYVNRTTQRVRIDFILKAKPHLIAEGFTEQFIGVEVKFFDVRQNHKFHGKSSRGIFQALSYWYSGAKWAIPCEVPQSLSTVLVLSNLSFSKEREKIFSTFDNYYKTLWKSYLSIANHANVGELEILEGSNGTFGWAMSYSGDKYFSKRRNGAFAMGNPNVINKTRIGNSK